MIGLSAKSALLAVVVLPFVACGGMPIYSAAPIEAWVVDSETNQLIEGAVVTANWQLVTGSLAGGEIPKGQLTVMEAVTDKSGHFYFEGWTQPNLATAELRDKDPQILIFKPDYNFFSFVSDYSPGRLLLGPNRKSAITGRTLRLSKFGGSLEKYADQLSILGTSLENIVSDCEWKKIPRMVLALDEERKRIKGINNRLIVLVPNVESLEGYSQRCGSARKFFEAYQK